MKPMEINWWHEILRLIPLIVMVCIFLATLDKQIALNQSSIEKNQYTIEKLETNHLPHIQARVDEISSKIDKVIGYLEK